MHQPSIDNLMDKMDSKYALSVAAAKRARQITDGAELLLDEETQAKGVGNKAVSIALTEIGEGKIEIEAPQGGIK
ncbi:MAG: DNA-directed RNA polymerase subunit omega [Peptococcia bacterium]